MLPAYVQVAACLNAKEAESAADTYGPLSGQVTSMTRQAVRRAVMEAGPCLVEAMSLCEVSAASEALAGSQSQLPCACDITIGDCISDCAIIWTSRAELLLVCPICILRAAKHHRAGY